METFDVVTIGRVFSVYRKLRHLSQQQVYHGICSKATYSRIENDDRDVDFYLLEILLSRIGVSIEEYDLMISSLDETLYRMRSDISSALFLKKYEDAKLLIQQYQELMPKRKIYQQYVAYTKATIQFYQCGNKKEFLSILEDILEMTEKSAKAFCPNELYSNLEMDAMLCFLSQDKYHDHEMDISQILLYIHHRMQGSLRMTYEVKALMILAQLARDHRRYTDALAHAENAVKILAESQEISVLAELHFFIATVQYEINQNKKVSIPHDEMIRECRMAYYLFDLYDSNRAAQVYRFVKEKLNGIL